MEIEVIQNKIYEIRDYKVMLDFDLAFLYDVETRILKQSTRRNITRFPPDFMFSLSEIEINQMVSQNVIPSKSYFGGSSPFAFIEQGIAMLSIVLKSEKAIEVNIAIIHAFVIFRQFTIIYNKLKIKIKEIESQFAAPVRSFRLVFRNL